MRIAVLVCVHVNVDVIDVNRKSIDVYMHLVRLFFFLFFLAYFYKYCSVAYR